MQVALPIILAWAILFGLAVTVKIWADATLRSSAGGSRGGLLGILTLPAQLIARAVLPGVNFIAHQTSKAALHYSGPVARWFHGLSAWWLALFAPFGLFAASATYAIERLTHVVLPREIGRRTRPIDRRARRAGKIAVGAALSGAALRKAINHWRHHRVEPALRNLLHRTTVALPRAIGRIRTRVKDVETQLAKPTRVWLRRLARYMWLAYLFGAVVKLLARKFPWLFCRKVKKVGGRVCGINDDLLNWAIGGTLLLSSPLSLEALAREMVQVSGLFVQGLQTLIPELQDAVEDYLGPSEPGIPASFSDYLG